MRRQSALILNCILLCMILGALFLVPALGSPIRYRHLDGVEAARLKDSCSEAAEPFFADLQDPELQACVEEVRKYFRKKAGGGN